MYDKEIKRFLKKLCVFSSPLFFVIILYVACDPFKVIWTHQRFFDDHVAHVGLNMDYVSTENFVNRNPSQHYNAFILGNSRSQYWLVDDWKKHIGEDARCYHYYGNGETLYALENNVKFIERQGNKIDFALLIFDAELLSQTEPMPGHLFCTPPRLVGYRNFLTFHATNFKAFLSPLFLYSYADLSLTKTLKPYMTEKFLIEQPVVYHPNSNEIVDEMFDKAIEDGTYYTGKRMSRFKGKQYPDSISPQVIAEKNKLMLTEIARIFKKHRTQYRVVINPLYNQILFNPADLQILQSIFGEDKVYDFSGRSPVTSDYHNYYEDSHYRPVIARQLMDSIYSGQGISLNLSRKIHRNQRQ